MLGYVTYTNSSSLYPVGNVSDWVMNNYHEYEPYAGYILHGDRSDELNSVMKDMFDVRSEYNTEGKYVFPLSDIYLPPKEYTIPVSRSLYMLQDMDNGYFLQIKSIGKSKETYMVARDIPLYIGKEGSFLLLDKMEGAEEIMDILSIKK